MARNAGTMIDAETKAVVSRIVGYRRPKRIILFGSRSRGDSKPDSDIDLCVLYDHLEKHNVEVLEELYLEIWGLHARPGRATNTGPVDLVVYDESIFTDRSRRPNSFESIIEKEGLTVYG